MKPKRLFTSLALTVTLVAACGPSVQQACQDFGDTFCDRIYECATGGQLAGIQAIYGQTADDCKQTERTKNNCAGAVSICPVGTNYDTGAAETCVANYRAAACSDITNPNYTVPGCATTDVCH
jgi:hypothetical protein